jgi:hypothetical protein
MRERSERERKRVVNVDCEQRMKESFEMCGNADCNWRQITGNSEELRAERRRVIKQFELWPGLKNGSCEAAVKILVNRKFGRDLSCGLFVTTSDGRGAEKAGIEMQQAEVGREEREGGREREKWKKNGE